MTAPEIAAFSVLEACLREETSPTDRADIAVVLTIVAIALRSPGEAADALDAIAARLR